MTHPFTPGPPPPLAALPAPRAAPPGAGRRSPAPPAPGHPTSAPPRPPAPGPQALRQGRVVQQLRRVLAPGRPGCPAPPGGRSPHRQRPPAARADRRPRSRPRGHVLEELEGRGVAGEMAPRPSWAAPGRPRGEPQRHLSGRDVAHQAHPLRSALHEIGAERATSAGVPPTMHTCTSGGSSRAGQGVGALPGVEVPGVGHDPPSAGSPRRAPRPRARGRPAKRAGSKASGATSSPASGTPRARSSSRSPRRWPPRPADGGAAAQAPAGRARWGRSCASQTRGRRRQGARRPPPQHRPVPGVDGPRLGAGDAAAPPRWRR